MKAKEVFQDPKKKKYSVKELLKEDRLTDAIMGMITMQRKLWETMNAESYAEVEKTFDTAIACMMANVLDVKLAEAGKEAGREGNMPVLQSTT